MSRWFRHYAGMMRDDKLVRVALHSKQTIERVVWVYGAILESAAEINDGGRYDFDGAEAAHFLHADLADVSAIEASLAACGRVLEGCIAKWGHRQFTSDDSAERVRRHRSKQKSLRNGSHAQGPQEPERYCNEVVTLRNGPETETETETQVKRKKDSCRANTTTKDEFEEFWKAKPRRKGDNPKAPAKKLYQSLVRAGAIPAEIVAGAREWARHNVEKIDTEFIPQAVKWLRDRRWEDYKPPPVDPDALAKQIELADRNGYRWDESQNKYVKKDAQALQPP